MIQSDFSDISQWTYPSTIQGYRDSNVNDSAHNYCMFSFVSAANAPNLTSNTFTARADLDSQGKFIKIYEPVNLSNSSGSTSLIGFDASVAISRTDPNIVIAAYCIGSTSLGVTPYYKISNNGQG